MLDGMNTEQLRTNVEDISSNVENSAKDFWANRPRRPRDGRLIAGVAVGIGRRYGIDPAIVRLVFVASILFGTAGLWLYLAGWLLLPAEDDGMPTGDMHAAGMNPHGTNNDDFNSGRFSN